MTAVHMHSVKTPVPPSHFQMATNGIYLAVPHHRNAIGIWSIADITCKPLELEGHRKKIQALCFSHTQPPTLICSAASDYIIVWNVERARHCLDTGQPIRGQITSSLPGDVRYVTFSRDDILVAACVDKEVLVLDSRQEKTIAILEGHTSRVNCAEFCPHYSSTLVTAGDDRTFKVWNISDCTLVYQSTIVSSSPFLCLSMNPLQEHFALGSADGQIRIYDLTDGNSFRCLHQFDVSKIHKKLRDYSEEKKLQEEKPQGPKTISSRPSWQRPDYQTSFPEPQEVPESSSAEIECSVLSVMYNQDSSVNSRAPTPTNLPFLQNNSGLVKDLMKSPPMLVIASTGCVVQVNASTMELSAFVDLQEAMQSSSLMEETAKVLSWAGNATIAEHPTTQQLVCLLGSCFQNEVHIVNISTPNQNSISQLKTQLSFKSSQNNPLNGHSISESTSSQRSESVSDRATSTDLSAANFTENAADCAGEYMLSLLSSAPLLPNSPLKQELVLKQKETKKEQKGSKSTPGLVDKKGKIVDKQPIVYKAKVKSSGYSVEEPRRVMFQPKTSAAKSAKPLQKSKSSSGSLVREYPMEGPAPTELRSKVEAAERPTAINSLHFSGDGSHCACGLSNTSAQVFKMPLSGKGFALAGHKGIVNSVSWSHDNKWLLSSSDDKTASVWSVGVPDPVMSFTLQQNNFGADKEGGLKPSADNALFGKAVRCGQFYYVDKFIMLTCGNSLNMYKFHLDTSKSDIKRYLSNNRYKLVKSYQMTNAQQITAFKAVNAFHSYLAICAGSDKSLEVFDMNTSQSVRIIPDVHARAVHSIALNEGSAYVSHVASAYDLFVTAAASDCIKLWDLRESRCVRRYEGHVNRSQPCGAAISPCSRFIASGSEDRSAYIFDIRSGTYLHKLTGHTDTVSDVAFHPLHPLVTAFELFYHFMCSHGKLMTGTLDGKLRSFTAVT